MPYLSFDGFHEPRNGDAFAGISMFSGIPGKEKSDYWSELIETRLSTPLIADHTYYVSYYVRLTFHLPQSYNVISIDKIGARLTANMIDTMCNAPMFFVSGPADIESPPGLFFTDTSKWFLISGIFHAKGGEQWLTLGAFYREHVNARLVYFRVNSIDSATGACNMLIDDVCVTDMANPVVSDTTVYSPQFPITIGQGETEGEYKWNTGDTSVQINVPGSGTYIRKRWSNCVYYIDKITVAEMAIESCVWLPSAFTPNNDGENDLFGPGSIYCQPDIQNFSFTIFSRWGQIVFQTNTPGEKWNGTYNGMPQEIGVYQYILKYSIQKQLSQSRQSSPEIKMVKGDVTLIR